MSAFSQLVGRLFVLHAAHTLAYQLIGPSQILAFASKPGDEGRKTKDKGQSAVFVFRLSFAGKQIPLGLVWSAERPKPKQKERNTALATAHIRK